MDLFIQYLYQSFIKCIPRDTKNAAPALEVVLKIPQLTFWLILHSYGAFLKQLLTHTNTL